MKLQRTMSNLPDYNKNWIGDKDVTGTNYSTQENRQMLLCGHGIDDVRMASVQ
jgi:hypothetical protein